MIIEKFGELYILGEAAELVIDETYPKLIEEHKLNTIGHPNVSIVKIAPENPLIFKAQVSLMPKAELPDYKKLAGEFSKETPDLIFISIRNLLLKFTSAS